MESSDENDLFFMASEANNIKSELSLVKNSIADMVSSVVIPTLPTNETATPSVSKSNAKLKLSYDEVKLTLKSMVDDVCKPYKVIEDELLSTKLKELLANNSVFAGKLATAVNSLTLLEERWCKLDTSVTELSDKINNIEQYGRLYNLILKKVARVPVKLKGHAFTDYVVKLLNHIFGHTLYRAVVPSDIDKCHPLYKTANNTYSIIVRFTNRDVRDDIYCKKNNLRKWGCEIVISENLTKKNQSLLSYAKRELIGSTVWSEQGKILTLNCKGKKTVLKSENDVDKLKSLLLVPSNLSTLVSASQKDFDNSTQDISEAEKVSNTTSGSITAANDLPTADSNGLASPDFPAIIQCINSQATSKGRYPHRTTKGPPHNSQRSNSELKPHMRGNSNTKRGRGGYYRGKGRRNQEFRNNMYSSMNIWNNNGFNHYR